MSWFRGLFKSTLPTARTILLDGEGHPSFSPNVVHNQKYNMVTFVPKVLYEQFKFFFNLYFLLVALSQFVPSLKIGYIVTYFGPLIFVLLVTMSKEASDDYGRYLRDKEANSQHYDRLIRHGSIQSIPASAIQVGHVIRIHKDQRIPADCVLLQTSDPLGTCFIRTDQLDGETDWKLRVAVPATQRHPDISAWFVDDGGVHSAPEARHPWRPSGSGPAAAAAADSALRQASVNSMTALTHDGPGQQSDFQDRAYDEGEREGAARPSALDLSACPSVYAGFPERNIYHFIGNITYETEAGWQTEPLNLENSLWCNTVLASAGWCLALVIYTGRDTRAAMNTSFPSTKVGLLDHEINQLSKILALVTFVLALTMVGLDGFRGMWYVYLVRFLILFSSIIPISLRVNLDMGKTFYSSQIEKDAKIPGTLVRTSTLPEELGRIEYLLSDKTGTLTKNQMELKRLHLGVAAYAGEDAFQEVRDSLRMTFAERHEERQAQSLLAQDVTAARGASGAGPASVLPAGVSSSLLDTPAAAMAEALRLGASSPHGGVGATNSASGAGAAPRKQGLRQWQTHDRVHDMMVALALCHNVSPIMAEEGGGYQAASPDEVAIVHFAESMGLQLVGRDIRRMTLRATHAPQCGAMSYEILQIFPFSSETKRMGIIVRDEATGKIVFYEKGADAVMAQIVQQNDWLEEECGNMAREGLRTLVMGRRPLSPKEYAAFDREYAQAQVALNDRNLAIQRVISRHLETNLELLGITGVDDALQDDVKATLEKLRNAGLKIWMLTGDKIETATCIAISAKLVASRQQSIVTIRGETDPVSLLDHLDRLRMSASLDSVCLVIDGESLQVALDVHPAEFFQLALHLPAVVACRCSPTQKAEITHCLRRYTTSRIAAIGDGGNDVSMIQAAHVGIGIVGKEGRQASLAADFSVTQFCHITRLLLWHGRNSYQRSAKLGQFIIHRGLVISVIQAVFSAIFYFAPIAIYGGFLLVGYATLFTMAPVFSLVLDRDISEEVALVYPELYRDLTKGRQLSYKTFFVWCAISVYQGGAIMLLALTLFESEFRHIVAISFTSLIFNELLMVALEINTWHSLMVISELVTFVIYLLSMTLLKAEFDLTFILTSAFVWKTALITAVSSLPLYFLSCLKSWINPANYTKLED